jgi:hypothetical protein
VAADVVWVDVLPSLDKFGKVLGDGTTAASKTAGKVSGETYSKAFGAAASTSVAQQQVDALQAASTKTKKVVNDLEQSIAKARASQREATAKVVLAEQQLADARAKSGDESADAQAAELRLEAARDRVTAASAKTTATEDQLKAAHREHKEVTTQLTDATGKLGDEAGKQPAKWKGVSESLETAKGGLETTTGKVGLLTGSLLGAAEGAEAFAQAWEQGMDLRRGVAELTAGLGLAKDESQQAGRIAGQVYADGWGESMDAVSAAIGDVLSSMDLRFESDHAIQDATVRALAFAQAFDVDVAEAARNAGILLRTGLAKTPRRRSI